MGRLIEAFAQFFDGAGDPLINGWLKFAESGSNNTLKNTYSDSVMQVPNTNPVQLDAEGRCPNIFGTGDYRVMSFTENIEDEAEVGEQIQMFDPVTAQGTSTGSTGTAFGAWDSTVTYGLDTIVSSSGNYYRSLIVSNLNNNPAVSPSAWEEIDFVRWWNANINYSLDEMVYYEGGLYFSLQNANVNQQPDITPTWWVPAGGGSSSNPVENFYVENILFPSGGDIGTALLPASDVYITNLYFPGGGDIGTVLLPITNAYINNAYITNAYVTNVEADELHTWVDLGGTTEVAPSGTFVNDAGGSLVVGGGIRIDTFVTENVWESLGPTGSGADNIWTALDNVPSDADWIEIKIIGNIAFDVVGGISELDLLCYLRKNGSSAAIGDTTLAIYCKDHISTNDKAHSVVVNNNVKVPVDGSIMFETYWDKFPSADTTESLYFYLNGWGFNP